MPLSPDGHKTCTKCGERKPLSEFFKNSESKTDGVMSRCKVCKKAQAAKWAEENRERRNAMRRIADAKPDRVAVARAWERRPEVKEKRAAAARNRRADPAVKAKIRDHERRLHVKAYRARYKLKTTYRDAMRRYRESEKGRQIARQCAARVRATPQGNIDNRMSSAIWRAVRKGDRSWTSLVGYTLADFMRHLEKQFLPGMGWHNFGDWHVDHIIPKASFCYESAEDPDFKECWSLSNLRPLWANENRKKGAKLVFLL